MAGWSTSGLHYPSARGRRHGEDLSGTVQALPDIIRTFRNNGVKLVTVPELLDLPEGK